MGNNPSTLGVRPLVGGFIMPRSGGSKVTEVKELTAASRQWQEWQRRSERSEGSGRSALVKKRRDSGFRLRASGPANIKKSHCEPSTYSEPVEGSRGVAIFV
jgi:hypothetical protein